MIVRILLIASALFFAFSSSALADSFPDPSNPPTLDVIRITCQAGWVSPDASQLRYEFSDRNDETVLNQPPDPNWCDEFVNLLNSAGDGDGSGAVVIPQETLMWWQASIDFLKFSQRIGAIFYPVVFGLRVVALIAHS